MASDAHDAGFLSRWSRRKALQRQGQALPEAPPAPAPAAASSSVAEAAPPAAVVPAASEAVPVAEAAVPCAAPAPTLDDVAGLTRESDYTRFMARDVRPEVKNAALGKLFADPHFNVMDGLDVYIDDYSKPDPLPSGMLRQLAQSRLLGLFDDDPSPPAEAHSAPTAEALPPPPPELAADENTDLQLQPDHDAGRTGAEAGAGEDPGRQH